MQPLQKPTVAPDQDESFDDFVKRASAEFAAKGDVFDVTEWMRTVGPDLARGQTHPSWTRYKSHVALLNKSKTKKETPDDLGDAGNLGR